MKLEEPLYNELVEMFEGLAVFPGAEVLQGLDVLWVARLPSVMDVHHGLHLHELEVYPILLLPEETTLCLCLASLREVYVV